MKKLILIAVLLVNPAIAQASEMGQRKFDIFEITQVWESCTVECQTSYPKSEDDEQDDNQGHREQCLESCGTIQKIKQLTKA